MTGSVPIRKLVNGQTLKGEIVRLFRRQNTGIIHGTDGYDVGFHALAVSQSSYKDLYLGERVTYQLWCAKNDKVPTAINVQPDLCSGLQQQPNEKPATLEEPR